jgi:DNA-binding NarL/FixJ family response regulator
MRISVITTVICAVSAARLVIPTDDDDPVDSAPTARLGARGFLNKLGRLIDFVVD